MTSRLFSLIALPLSLVGHLLFWPGSAGLLRATQRFDGGLDIGALALVVVGIAVIAAAVATLAIGWLGVIVLGGVHIVFSLLLHLVPIDLRADAFSPAFELMNAARGASAELGDGMFFYFPPGAGLIIGVVLVAAGLASDARRTPPAGPARGLSALAGVGGVFGLVLALAGGAITYVRLLVMLAGADALGLALLYVGAILVGAAVYVSRWSSAGAFVLGGVTVLAGLALLAAPRALVGPVPTPELRRALELAGPSGLLLLIGVVVLVAGLAVRYRARRAIPAAV